MTRLPPSFKILLVLNFALGTILNTAALANNHKEQPLKIYPYKRIDFEVKGKNCPPCIRRLTNKLKKTNGIMKADISIKEPHCGVIVFDRDKIKLEKIVLKVKSEKMRIENIEEENLKTIPRLLVPKSLMRILKSGNKEKSIPGKDNF